MISGASNSSVFSAFSIQLRWFWMRRSTLLLPRHDHLATTDIAAHALHLIFVSSVTPVRPGRQGFLFCSDFRHESLLLGLWALHSCYLGFLFGWSVFFFSGGTSLMSLLGSLGAGNGNGFCAKPCYGVGLSDMWRIG
jgi:hypothetical protein